MSIKLSAALATLAVAAAAAHAHAATVYLTDVGPRASMSVAFPGLFAETTPYVGQINWTFDPLNPANGLLASLISGNSFGTFCIEGTQNVYLNSNATFANLFSDISLAPQDNVGSAFAMGVKSTALNRFWDAYYNQATLSDANGAAFQLGIWELLYDNSPNLSGGAFLAAPIADADSTAAFAQAQIWLATYNSIIPNTHYQLFALSDPNLQDQLFGIPIGGQQGETPTAPLPAALPAGLVLIGVLGIVRKLRRRSE